jgi:hypothetical protein
MVESTSSAQPHLKPQKVFIGTLSLNIRVKSPHKKIL